MRLRRGIQLAGSLKKQGSFDEAASAYREALSLARTASDRKEEILCLYELGILCWNLGQFDNAFNSIRSAAELAEWVGKVRRIAGQAQDTYVFFNNHYNAQAVQNARLFTELLDAES